MIKKYIKRFKRLKKNPGSSERVKNIENHFKTSLFGKTLNYYVKSGKSGKRVDLTNKNSVLIVISSETSRK